MYRELPVFQTLFDALEELCDEDNPGGESPTLPLHLAPAVVHTFDRVMMERVQSSSREYTVKGRLCGYRMLQEHSWFVLKNAVVSRDTCHTQKRRKANEVARCERLLVRCYDPYAEAAYEPSEVKTECPYTVEVVEKEKKRRKKMTLAGGAGRGKKKVAKTEGEFDPTLHATVIVSKEKVGREKGRSVDWQRPLPYNEKLRRAKTEEERQALAVAQVGVKEALKGRFRKSVVEYPHRCVEAPRPRPLLDLAVVNGATLVSSERNYAVVMGLNEQSLAGWASKTGGTLALAPHNVHVAEGGSKGGRDTYTTRRRNHIGHLTLNLTKIGAGHESFSSSDAPLSPSYPCSPSATRERRRLSSQTSSPPRWNSWSSSPPRLRSLSPSSSLHPSPPKSSHGLKHQKLDHKPHNSLGAYKIPKKGSDPPANEEMLKDVDTIKKEPIDFEENEEEYYKPDEDVWVKEEKETCHEANEDLVDDLLEESKEVEEELVKGLLEESEEKVNKEEDEFGFLDDLMMDLKGNKIEGGHAAQEDEEGHHKNEEELQNDLLLANL